MKIAILGGTGRMGVGLATSYARAGHEVMVGSRDPGRAAACAAQISGQVPEARVHGAGLKTSAAGAELIVLAVPFHDVTRLVAALSDQLSGKTIVDITNPFGAVPVGKISGVEHNAKALRPEARWVAAYKTNFWKTLSLPVDGRGAERQVFICSDDAGAKDAVSRLVESTGFRPVDCGKLENARILDPMVPLMLELDGRYGGDCTSGWAFLD